MEITQDLPKNSIITLAFHSKVKISENNISGLNARGNGDFIITGLSKNTDLSKIFNNGNNIIHVDKDLDFEGELCEGEIVVAEGKTLKISAKKANGRRIIGNGTVIITDTDKYPDADLSLVNTDEYFLQVSEDTALGDTFDFSKFSVTKGISTSKNEDIKRLDKNIPINVPEGETLYLTADEADGRIINGKGKVIITNLHEKPTADLSQIYTNGSVIVDVKENTKFLGKLHDGTTIKLSNGAKFTSRRDILNNIYIFGDGSTEDDTGNKIPINVPEGETLYLTADEADGRIILTEKVK